MKKSLKFFLQAVAMNLIAFIILQRMAGFGLYVNLRKIVDTVFTTVILVECIIIAIFMFEEFTHYFENRTLDKAEQTALNSKNKDDLLKISKEYSSNYDIICTLLRNQNLSDEILDYWLFKGAWGYGLITENCYGPIEVNQRLKLLELCVNHKNMSSGSLATLSNKILQSKDYFVEKCYPADDYYLIDDLLKSDKLSKDLKNHLLKYLKRRKKHEKSNRSCDTFGFAYTVNELIDDAFKKSNATE